MSENTVPVEKIQELIDVYRGCKIVCRDGSDTGESPELRALYRGRAALYRTVMADLEGLLPPRTLADIPHEDRYECMWREARNLLGEHFMVVRIWEDKCNVLWAEGIVTIEKNSDVIPLMDKPRGVIPWANV